jgi:hypothetical protein
MTTVTLALLATAGLAISTTSARASSKDNVEMISMGADDDANGRALLAIRSTTEGRFEVRVRGLAADTTYELLLNDVHIGDITTSGGGKGRARFRTRPRDGKDQFLGFDPRAGVIVVRDSNGVDLLTALVPDTSSAPDGDIVCCVPDDEGPECEDRTPEECAAEGGTVSTATSCLPDPCGGTPTPDDADIVCCVSDDSGPECEDRTVEECAAEGGMAVSATTCVDNPCAGTPSADPDTRCCEPDDSGAECEDRTPAECVARSGVDIGAGICAVDSCDGVIPPGGVNATILVTCEKRSSRSRASIDGNNLIAGSYHARLVSGANEATSNIEPAVGDEAEFDFDSDAGDIAAGATAIAAAFLQGDPPQALGQILDSQGNLVAESLVTCEVH